MVELRNILLIFMYVFIALVDGMTPEDKKLEAQSCECANTGNGGKVECIFIMGMNMALEGPNVTAKARACRYKDGHSIWNIALGTGNKMKIIKKRCVMCYKCLPEGMECLKLPKGHGCPTEMPPMISKKKP